MNRDLAERLAKEIRNFTQLALMLLLLSLIIGLVLRYLIGTSPSFDGRALGAYSLVWAGSMAGVVVSNVALPAVNRISDYQNQRRLLSQPLFRTISVGLIGLVVALALENGGLTFKVGALDLTQVEANAGIALLIGFVSTLIGSDLVKALIARFKRQA